MPVEPAQVPDEDGEVIDIVKIHEDIKNVETLEEENLKRIEDETRRLEEDRIRFEVGRLVEPLREK